MIHAITWGHNKDHRPDLKQLLFTLTVSSDGAVPVYPIFRGCRFGFLGISRLAIVTPPLAC
jgi:hypothetical protein